PEHVSYLDNPRYADALAAKRAGAVLVPSGVSARVPPGSAAILCAEPGLAWIKVAALFHPAPPLRPGAHPTAVVDPTAQVDPTAEIGPLAVVGARAEIVARCWIGPGAVIGEGVVVGPDSRIAASASVSHALLGARVVVHPGARIGQEGFSLVPSPDGLRTLPQLGRVIIQDDVEIGANTTIDRGALSDTVIGAGSRLDNLVQVGHNARIGRCCVVVAQAGISGSTVLEDFVTIAAQAGLTGHLRVGRGARVGAQAGVMADLPPGAEVVGSPAQPVRAFFRQVAALRRLARKGRDGAEDEGTG
ncbi:MAG: UDP-3-O-(3-hydroxymyristoyl)glucosamine N-acyltransferase, partial [Acetobacteraceae bacterium]|nr:UDP-3-O-(3-hydroxymyristoyl)glucosamine N-acyltransferase [Acetobacteraceae bacterium]